MVIGIVIRAPQEVALSQGRTKLALATLFLGTFVMGSAELLMVGVLDLIAADLQISIPVAGRLVTAYALGLAIGGPILTALTIRLNKRPVLVGTVILFVLANLVPVLTGSYGPLLAARAFAGALQGLFLGVGFVVATSIVPRSAPAGRCPPVIGGTAVSAALGVPLGTLIGQALGWRGSYTAIVALGVLALIATLVLVPPVPSTGGGAAGQARYAFAPRVLAMLAWSVLAYAALLAALTYIVPFLQSVTGLSGAPISVFLLAYGAATAVGAFAGGRFADQDAARTLIVATICVTASLLALFLVGAIALLVALAVLALGLFGSGMGPSLQYRTVRLAGPGGQLASSLPASAINLGIALGSFAGGLAIGSFTASAAVVTGLILAVLAVPVAWATSHLRPPVVDEAAPAAAEPTPAREVA